MTVTVDKTLAGMLDDADPNTLPDALRQVKLGTLLRRNQTTASQAASNTITLDPPAQGPATVAVRVTGGAASSGPRQVTDSGGTPDATTATLSDDGTTLTFEADVTDYVLSYQPAPSADLSSDFPETGPG